MLDSEIAFILLLVGMQKRIAADLPFFTQPLWSFGDRCCGSQQVALLLRTALHFSASPV
jgi:hypothetical protein